MQAAQGSTGDCQTGSATAAESQGSAATASAASGNTEEAAALEEAMDNYPSQSGEDADKEPLKEEAREREHGEGV